VGGAEVIVETQLVDPAGIVRICEDLDRIKVDGFRRNEPVNRRSYLAAFLAPIPRTATIVFATWWRAGPCLSRTRSFVAPMWRSPRLVMVTSILVFWSVTSVSADAARHHRV
jgi:hypothetical protein